MRLVRGVLSIFETECRTMSWSLGRWAKPISPYLIGPDVFVFAIVGAPETKKLLIFFLIIQCRAALSLWRRSKFRAQKTESRKKDYGWWASIIAVALVAAL